VTTDSGPAGGNPKIYELIKDSPKEGPGPTIWAWPQIIDYLKVAGQPVQGPWPPHQEPRPDPTVESLPVAVPDPQSSRHIANPQSRPDDAPRSRHDDSPASRRSPGPPTENSESC
jgi:hypothetical protein